MKYSKSKNAFYHETLNYADLPSDLVEITQNRHIEILSEIESGKVLAPDKKGYPIAIDAPVFIITDEQKREKMIISAAQARINLARKGLLKTVNAAIMSLEEDNEMRILWEFEVVLHRNNAILIEFCKNNLSINDEEIDALFNN